MKLETPRERREREALERCRTEAQRARVRELHAQDICCYPESRQGKGVVAACRRYLETGDAGKIDEGLYRFAIAGAGGLNEIAHYDINGFRHVYADPAKFLDLIDHEESRPFSRQEHSSYVYTDGMTSQEVRGTIVALAAEHAGGVRARSENKRREEAFALASALGREFGFDVRRADG